MLLMLSFILMMSMMDMTSIMMTLMALMMVMVMVMLLLVALFFLLFLFLSRDHHYIFVRPLVTSDIPVICMAPFGGDVGGSVLLL